MRIPLTLKRPLISLDVETHSLVPPEQARIVELGFKVLYPLEHCTACYGTGVNVARLDVHQLCDACGGLGQTAKEPKRWVSYIRPDMLISEGATAVHGITNAVVLGCAACGGHVDNTFVSGPAATPCTCPSFTPWPTFKELAVNLAKGFSNCDFCGYNVRFDLRVISAEMQRAGVEWSQGDARLLDSMHLWRIGEPRTLTHAVRKFLGREPSEAHRALGDAEDALDVAFAQLEMWPDLPRDIGKLHDMCYDVNNVDPDGRFVWFEGEAVFSFGKWKNTQLRQVPESYLQWVLNKGDFSSDVKRIVLAALNGVYPVKNTIADESSF